MRNEAKTADHPFLVRPHHTLLGLMLPVLLSLVAEPLTGLVDTAYIARLGAAPLAALGVGTMALSVPLPQVSPVSGWAPSAQDLRSISDSVCRTACKWTRLINCCRWGGHYLCGPDY